MPKLDSAGKKLSPEPVARNPPPAPPTDPLETYWQTADNETVRYYLGDVCDVLARLPMRSVHCVVTSPPYWGLRDYGTGTWEGGDPECDHVKVETGYHSGSTLGPNRDGLGPDNAAHVAKWRHIAAICGKCDARRIDRQIGSEPSPDCGTHGQAQCVDSAGGEPGSGCFVCRMVRVFREVRRVLRDDGTLWLNLGDSYTSGGRVGHGTRQGYKQTTNRGMNGKNDPNRVDAGLRNGNLVGVPWRVALALQADGWVLRQDIIWSKPAPMPESVRNRCTKAHEYIFLLTKSTKYYYDAEAVKETSKVSTPGEDSYRVNGKTRTSPKRKEVHGKESDDGCNAGSGIVEPSRNKRSVWSVRHERALLDWLLANHEDVFHKYLLDCLQKGDVWRIASFGYPGAHFATYPPKLITPCILAGTSAHGCCAECGAPWRRVVAEAKLTRERPNEYVKRAPVFHGGGKGSGGSRNDDNRGTNNPKAIGNTCANTVAGVETRTVGWGPTCTCNGQFEERKGKRLGYGRYHDHKLDGVQYGLYQDGMVFKGSLSEGYNRPLKELDTTVREYVSDLSLDEHPVVPCVVLDPFIGSGTTAEVCVEHGRHCWGIDLSAQYLEKNAVPRVRAALLARPITAWLAGKETGVEWDGSSLDEVEELVEADEG